MIPSIDYNGKYYVRAASTGGASRAAVTFPVEADRFDDAVQFTEETVLKMLPGWDRGQVMLFRYNQKIHSWVLIREVAEAARKEGD